MLRSLVLAVAVVAVEESCGAGSQCAAGEGVSLLQLRRTDLHGLFADIRQELNEEFPNVQSYDGYEEAPAEPRERIEADEVAMTEDERAQHEANFVRLCSGTDETCTSSHARAMQVFEGSVPVVNAAEIAHARTLGFEAGYQDDPIFQQLSKMEFERDYHGLIIPEGEELLEVDVNATERERLLLLEQSLPASFHPSDKWPQCKKLLEMAYGQGACGSCWAFAMAHAFDARMCIATGDVDAVVSREDVKACGGGSCGGGWPATAWGVAARSGYVHEPCWQYKTVNEQCSNKPKCRYTFKPTGTRRSFSGSQVAQIKEELMTRGPLSFASCTDSFGTYKGGILDCKSRSCPMNHAMSMIGWGQENGVDYWLLMNSWGSRWGEGGTARLKIGGNCKESHFYALDVNPATYKVTDESIDERVVNKYIVAFTPLKPQAAVCEKDYESQVRSANIARGLQAQIAVTCCSGNTPSRPGCKMQASYAEAVAHCKKYGQTLCDKSVIERGGSQRKGCNGDVYGAWTSNSCGGEDRRAPVPTPAVTPRPTPAPPTPRPTPPPTERDGSIEVLAASVCVYTTAGVDDGAASDGTEVRCCVGDQPTEAPYVHKCRKIATMEGVAHDYLKQRCKGMMQHTADLTHVWTSAPCA